MISTEDPETDEALVAKLARGDDDALRVLFGRHAALVFTIASRVVGPASAEEVLQDVFLTIWQKREAFDPARGSFKSWIGQIARRRALNELRRARARGERAEARGEDGQALDDLPDDALGPDEAHWATHKKAALRAAVDALPETERVALSLAFFDELTHEQVAAALGTPLGTAKTRIRLGLKRLAPLVLMLVVVTLLVGGLWRVERERSREETALAMVTSSDVVPLRLGPALADVPPNAHGNYRARPGVGVVVLTTSNLPKPATGGRYVAWSRHGTTWQMLGYLDVDADGHALLVANDSSRGARPDELRVTLEIRPGPSPAAAPILAWPR